MIPYQLKPRRRSCFWALHLPHRTPPPNNQTFPELHQRCRFPETPGEGVGGGGGISRPGRPREDCRSRERANTHTQRVFPLLELRPATRCAGKLTQPRASRDPRWKKAQAPDQPCLGLLLPSPLLSSPLPSQTCRSPGRCARVCGGTLPGETLYPRALPHREKHIGEGGHPHGRARRRLPNKGNRGIVPEAPEGLSGRRRLPQADQLPGGSRRRRQPGSARALPSQRVPERHPEALALAGSIVRVGGGVAGAPEGPKRLPLPSPPPPAVRAAPALPAPRGTYSLSALLGMFLGTLRSPSP